MKEPTCTLYGGHSLPFENVHVVFFSFIPQGNEKNLLSILIILFYIIFIQNLRENSHKIKQNSN